MKLKNKKVMTHLEEKYDSVFLRISAHDRNLLDNAESSSSFKVKLPGSSRQYSRVVGIQVLYVSIPNVFYNVPDDHNIRIERIGGTTHYFDIPKGQYTIDEILARLETVINTGPFSYITLTTSLDTYTNQVSLTFTDTGGFAYAIYWSDLFAILGFDADQFPITTSVYNSFTLQASHTPRLQGVSEVFVTSPEMSVDTSDVQAGMERDVMVSVPMNVEYGVVAHYTPSHSIMALHEFSTERSINQISLELMDAKGRLLDIHDHDWTIFFKVYYVS